MGLLTAVLWLEFVETDDLWAAKGVMLAFLCADGLACCMFYTLHSWRFEVKSQDISGVVKLVAVPGRLKARLQASILYALLLAVASCVHYTSLIPDQIGPYIVPLLILLRHENIW